MNAAYGRDPARFSRAWWKQIAHDAFWIVLVSLLIWIFADMKFNDQRNEAVTLRLSTQDSPDTIIIDGDGNQRQFVDVRVLVEVKGSRESLDLFDSKLGQPILVNLVNAKPGEDWRHNSVDILNKMPQIVESGLMVQRADPDVLNVHVDEQLHEDVPVEFVYTNGELAEEPTHNVVVLAARSKWEEILSRTEGHPRVRTVSKDLADVETNTPTTVEFTLVPQIARVPVQLQADTVKVDIQVTQRTATRALTVAVGLLTPSGWATDGTWYRYELVGQGGPLEWRKEITIVGNRQDLDRLDPRDVSVYLPLREDDKAPVSWMTRPVVVKFPAGSTVKLAGDPPTVSFRLVETPPAVAPAATASPVPGTPTTAPAVPLTLPATMP